MRAVADSQETEIKPAERENALMNRLIEVAIFAGVILFSCVIIIAFAVAAPFVLAVTALSGFSSRKTSPRRWKPANI